MTTRTLARDDGRTRLYEIRDDSGKVIGTDEEPVSKPDDSQAKFREAVSKASTLEQLKAAILGTTTGVEADTRPRGGLTGG